MAGRGRIDVHHHLVPREHRRWLEGRGAAAGGLAIPSWSVAAAVDVMDAQEIGTAILSVSAPGVDVAGDPAADVRARARQVNDEAAELRRTRPDRFGFFATLPLPDVQGALEEARRAFDDLGADGVVLLSSVRGRYLGDPRFRPLFEELDRRHAVVLVHPTDPPGTPTGELPAYAVDFLLETTRSALSLARSGVLDLPHLRIILCHAGGFLPYAAYRASLFARPGPAMPPLPGLEVSFPGVKRLRRFYVELALSASPTALPSVLAFAAPGHVLFGSDFPYAPAALGGAVTRMLDRYDLPDDVRLSIDRGAAETLFPRLAPHPAGAGPARTATDRSPWWRGRRGRP